MSLVRVENLKKIYISGNKIETSALKGISLDVQPKDFSVIAGPSGSGKSTLLHLIGCLDSPTEGKIFFDKTDTGQIPQNQISSFRLRNLGFVFQAYNLLPTLTAYENVEYIMLLQGIDAKIREEKTKNVLERVGLKAQIHRFPSELSGGQQQRVAVARAIASNPKLVLADEPTANLDSKTAASLIDLMLELNQEQETTFIFSTHDQTLMNKAKKLIHLKDGEISS